MQVPIPTLHLFPVLDQKLIDLLRSLSPHDWEKTTRAKLWTVKDIASHLLDGNIRTLSMSRDGYFGDPLGQINTYHDLVNYLNSLNADWVRATRRLSPTVLIDLLESTGKEYYQHLTSLPLFDKAIFSVAWAGENESANWFHIAREYTEKWHHQQQIREAVAKPGIMDRDLYFPVLNTFMQALPHTFRDVKTHENSTIRIEVTGTAGGVWFLMFRSGKWQLVSDNHYDVESTIIIDEDNAWRQMTKGLSRKEADLCIQIEGDKALAEPFFNMLSVMA